MTFKNRSSILIGLIWFIGGAFLATTITSCGKQGAGSPKGINVQYHILNLSPDLNPVNLFIDFKSVNTTPYIFGLDQGYFYVPSIDTPYQIRSALTSGVPILSRGDILTPGSKYTLYITGAVVDKSLTTIFTVDTASLPTIGRGKIRFVNASPTEKGGLDLFANGTLAFGKVVYPGYSKYIELPNGNYDFQITETGSTTVLKDVPSVTIQDGRLYTLYAYGYTTRTDTATFNAAMITNR